MRLNIKVFVGAMLGFLLAQSGSTQQPASTIGSDWPMYRSDQAGTGFSSLSQIDTKNVASLSQAWTFSLISDATPVAAARGRGGAGGVNSEATPIVVGGVMYAPTANRVVALESETGKEIWSYVLSAGAPSRRGVAYWSGQGADPPRIVFTSGRRLIELNARNGAIVTGFGKDGEVDLGIPYNSVPGISKNVVVVGANTPQGTAGGIGNPRAFDVRTGAKLWEFSSVPQPGSPGHDTWEGESWKDRLGVNAWPFYFTVDEQRGLLYLPLALPIGVITEETARVPTCSGTRSSLSISKPAPTSGTFKPFIMTCGTMTHRRLQGCSISCAMDARFPFSR